MITLEPPRGVPEGAEGWRALGLSRVRLTRFLKSACEDVGLSGRVDVLLTTDAVLKRLNRTYRGKDKATDVLSFPAAPEMVAAQAGDLAISLQTAARQADQQAHPLEQEVRVLLLHGLLHLHGMDHEADSGEMAAREAELRTKLRLPHGLIGRAEKQETGNRKQEAGNSREQGIGNRSQGTGSRRQLAAKPAAIVACARRAAKAVAR